MPDEPSWLLILSYHKIGRSPGDWESWYYVPEDLLRAQLSWILDRGWEGVELNTFLAGLDDAAALPSRSLLVTFDDGYRSLLTNAVPVLRDLRLPGVVFVPSDFIGRSNEFDDGMEPEEPICSWEDLRELEAAGIAVQSHGASHRRFSELDPATLAGELTRSRRTLEEGLQRPVEVIAYPYGDNQDDSTDLRGLVEEAGYRAGCLYGGGANPLPPPDRFALTRAAMGPDTPLDPSVGPLADPIA